MEERHVSNDSIWQEAGMPEVTPAPEAAPTAVGQRRHRQGSSRWRLLRRPIGAANENLASATLRLVDAAQDFTGLIKAYVSAGQELERSLAMVRELANASQKALEDARRSDGSSVLSQRRADGAAEDILNLIQRSTSEHLALAELTDNLRKAPSALAVLGEPIERHGSPADLTELGSRSWDAA